MATSVVVFDVRPGNPKHIENWNDLTQPGLEILTPDPAQSGGAKWNIVAAYGASMRGNVPGYAANDPAAAEKLLEGIFKNVTVMDKSANDSIKNFQSGNGDVAITYEYAVLAAQKAGLPDEAVIPPSTVSDPDPRRGRRQERPGALREDIANAFVKYLHTQGGAGPLHERGVRAVREPQAARRPATAARIPPSTTCSPPTTSAAGTSCRATPCSARTARSRRPSAGGQGIA